MRFLGQLRRTWKKTTIRDLAKKVLDARAEFPEATLAELYDDITMKDPLRQAHDKLDKAVDAIYHAGGFITDLDRVNHLFRLYEKMVTPKTDPSTVVQMHPKIAA